MATFNSFQLRKGEDGKTFLDLELTLALKPQRILMQMSFLSTADFMMDQRDLSQVSQPFTESQDTK